MEITYPPYTAPLYPLPNVNTPSEPLPAGVEVFPIVEENGLVKGRMTREYAHGGSMELHPVVHLHLINRMGAMYLQKRSMSKKLLPGYWDTAVGGHVSYGEQISEALFRESQEELGLYDFNPVPVTSYVYQSPVEKELVYVFACVGDYNPQPNEDEVDEGRWWTEEELAEAKGKSILTPNFESEYEMIHDKLYALL